MPDYPEDEIIEEGQEAPVSEKEKARRRTIETAGQTLSHFDALISNRETPIFLQGEKPLRSYMSALERAPGSYTKYPVNLLFPGYDNLVAKFNGKKAYGDQAEIPPLNHPDRYGISHKVSQGEFTRIQDAFTYTTGTKCMLNGFQMPEELTAFQTQLCKEADLWKNFTYTGEPALTIEQLTLNVRLKGCQDEIARLKQSARVTDDIRKRVETLQRSEADLQQDLTMSNYRQRQQDAAVMSALSDRIWTRLTALMNTMAEAEKGSRSTEFSNMRDSLHEVALGRPKNYADLLTGMEKMQQQARTYLEIKARGLRGGRGTTKGSQRSGLADQIVALCQDVIPSLKGAKAGLPKAAWEYARYDSDHTISREELEMMHKNLMKELRIPPSLQEFTADYRKNYTDIYLQWRAIDQVLQNANQNRTLPRFTFHDIDQAITDFRSGNAGSLLSGLDKIPLEQWNMRNIGSCVTSVILHNNDLNALQGRALSDAYEPVKSKRPIENSHPSGVDVFDRALMEARGDCIIKAQHDLVQHGEKPRLQAHSAEEAQKLQDSYKFTTQLLQMPVGLPFRQVLKEGDYGEKFEKLHSVGGYSNERQAFVTMCIDKLLADGLSPEELMDPTKRVPEKQQAARDILDGFAENGHKYIAGIFYGGSRRIEDIFEKELKTTDPTSPNYLHSDKEKMLSFLTNIYFDAAQEVSHCEAEYKAVALEKDPSLNQFSDPRGMLAYRSKAISHLVARDKDVDKIVFMVTKYKGFDAHGLTFLLTDQLERKYSYLQMFPKEMAEHGTFIHRPDEELQSMFSMESAYQQDIGPKVYPILTEILADPRLTHELMPALLDGSFADLFRFSKDPESRIVTLEHIPDINEVREFAHQKTINSFRKETERRKAVDPAFARSKECQARETLADLAATKTALTREQRKQASGALKKLFDAEQKKSGITVSDRIREDLANPGHITQTVLLSHMVGGSTLLMAAVAVETQPQRADQRRNGMAGNRRNTGGAARNNHAGNDARNNDVRNNTKNPPHRDPVVKNMG